MARLVAASERDPQISATTGMSWEAEGTQRDGGCPDAMVAVRVLTGYHAYHAYHACNC
jgi:hypothetical protein